MITFSDAVSYPRTVADELKEKNRHTMEIISKQKQLHIIVEKKGKRKQSEISLSISKKKENDS